LEKLSGKMLRQTYWELVRTIDDTTVPKIKQLINERIQWPSDSTKALENSIVSHPTGFRQPTMGIDVMAGGLNAPYVWLHETGFWITKPSQLRAMAVKKGGLEEAGTGKLPIFVSPKWFMRDGLNMTIPIILDRLNRKISELTR